MELKQIDVSRIDPSPWQLRPEMDEQALDRLSASISRLELLQPVKVRPLGNRYQLIYGHRRLIAAKRAGAKYIAALVDQVQDRMMRIQNIAENVQREDLPDYVKEEAIVDEIAAGVSLDNLSLMTGYSTAWLESMEDAHRFRLSAKERVDEASIWEVPTKIIEITKGLDEGDRLRFVERYISGEFPSQRQLSEAVATFKTAKSLSPAIARAIADEKVDVGDVSQVLAKSKDTLKRRLLEEPELGEAWREELVERKKRREKAIRDMQALREIEAEEDAAVLSGEIKAKKIDVDLAADERRLRRFEDIYESIRWLSQSDLEAFESQKYRDRALDLLRRSWQALGLLLR